MRTSVRDLSALASRVKALRLSRGWTQKQAYDACRIDKTTWNNYETGVSRPTVDNAAAMCEVFGVSLDYIYAGDTSRLNPDILKTLYGKEAVGRT